MSMVDGDVLTPNLVPPGSSVRVVSPSLPSLAFARQRRDIATANLSELGLSVRWSQESLEVSDDGLSAGSAAQRANDLMDAFLDPGAHLIFCAAGGRTSAELLPLLDLQVFRSNPKPFIGRSDNIFLNAYLLEVAGLSSFSGAAFLPQFGEKAVMPETQESFRAVLQQSGPVMYVGSTTITEGNRPWQQYTDEKYEELPRPRLGRSVWLRPGKASGRLVGGELDICTRLLDLNLLNTRNRVLWLDMGQIEFDYARSRLSAIFDQIEVAELAGLLIADNPWADFDQWKHFIDEWATGTLQDHHIPVHLGGNCGHYDPAWILPYGGVMTLDSRKGIYYRKV